MPYTPPSHRSPASSTSASPDVSRRSSIASIASGNRPSLPRSASYLNKHRRTPLVTSVDDSSSTPSPPYTASDELKSSTAPATSSSLRQSPSPVTDDKGIPNAAIISPPDSASSGSEDEGRTEMRGRKLGQLQDLRDAVSQIPQARTPSPNQDITESPVNIASAGIMRSSFSTNALGDLPKSGRRVGHVRSATDPNASTMMTSTESSLSTSEDSDEDLRKKPQMVRKKSGELVRPALRVSHRRPSSMPGTPVFAKAVHFDSHLEHIRHFLQVDRPLAVSAGSSPVDNYESDTEYPFPGGEKKGAGSRGPPFEWELVTNNFPHDSISRRELPVRLEKVWLSSDQKSMLGSIAVANLSFQKSVACRFTLDYWKTTSEVVAEYSHEIRPRETPIGQDRFTFSIKLSETTNLESKTLLFCLRYNVSGQEHWDNNNSANFQIDFKKKHKPQNGKNNFQGVASRPLNGLPRSNRRQSPSAAPRPVSMPTSLDDFGKKPKFSFEQPLHEYLGEPGHPLGLRLKTRSAGNLAGDNIKGLTSPSGVAFANRYDFGASLSAAVQAAKDTMGKDKDALYMKRNVRDSPPVFGGPSNDPKLSAGQPASATPSSKVGLASSSYEELVSKYCFFGSKQSNSAVNNEMTKGGEYDGSKGEMEPSTASPSPRRTGSAAHHGFHQKDLKQTFPPAAGYNAPSTASLKATPSTAAGRGQSSSPKTAVGARSHSPSFSVAGTSPSDVPFLLTQQVLPERFPWGGETHAATAIRG